MKGKNVSKKLNRMGKIVVYTSLFIIGIIAGTQIESEKFTSDPSLDLVDAWVVFGRDLDENSYEENSYEFEREMYTLMEEICKATKWPESCSTIGWAYYYSGNPCIGINWVRAGRNAYIQKLINSGIDEEIIEKQKTNKNIYLKKMNIACEEKNKSNSVQK